MTIKQIANLAEVSIATVSKVLNHKTSDLRPETISKVEKIIEKYNYIPYQKAIARVHRQSNYIALLVPDCADVFSASLLRGAEDYFSSYSYSVIVCNTENNPEKENHYIEHLKKLNVKAMIRFPLQKLTNEEDQLSYVFLDETNDDKNLRVVFNNREGANLAVTHLIQNGHKKIGIMVQDVEKNYMNERFLGYKEALLQNNISFDKRFVFSKKVNLKSRRESGFQAANFLIDQGVTAMFCCDDHMAVGAYKAIKQKGLSIPEDISIIGFDNTNFCDILEPNLTSVHQSAYEIGFQSAELLYSHLLHQKTVKRIEIQAKLVQRASVGPPKKKKDLVVVIGYLYQDYAFSSQENEIQSVQTSFSGFAYEQAIKIAKEGKTVCIVSCIGPDDRGKQVKENLQNMGINCDYLFTIADKETGFRFAFDSNNLNFRFEGANNSIHDIILHDVSNIICQSEQIEIDPSLNLKFQQNIFNLWKGKIVD